MVGPERPQFVLFGSSIVQFSYRHEGWGAILNDIYARKADILLRGYSGWNSRCALQVLDKVFPKDAAVQPSLVIVYFGGNDSVSPQPGGIGSHVPLPEYVDNMRKIAIHLMSLSAETRVIFLTAPAIDERKVRHFFGNNGRKNDLCRIYSEACLQLCKELSVESVDLYTSLKQRDDRMRDCFTDGVHLSSEGSKIVVREILKILREANWEPSLYWKSLPSEFANVISYSFVGPDGNTMPMVEPEFHEYMELEQ
ncbi:hypothetical protein ACFE04_030161 [Oxalis oulophora]